MLQFKIKALIGGITILIISVIVLIGVKMLPKNNITNKSISITQNTKSLKPIQVVENYFKYYNEKKQEGVNSTLTESNQKPIDFSNLKSINILDIQESADPYWKEIYIKSGKGRNANITEKDISVCKVDYRVKYKKNIGPQPSGEYIWRFILIRKDENSPWLIDSWGEG